MAGLLLLTVAVTAGLAALLQQDRPAEERPDPALLARQDAEHRLAAGAAVTLVGDLGPPGYFEWAWGEQQAKASTTQARPFQVSAVGLALVEFPYAARLKHYRLRAEVRHDGSPDRGTVGIYCCRQSYNGLVPLTSLLCLHFADSGRPLFDKQGIILPKPAQFEFRYLEPHPNGTFDLPVGLRGSRPFFAARPNFGDPPAPWRRLTLEVGPKTVRVLWALERNRQELVTEMPLAAALAEARVVQDAVKQADPKKLLAGVELEIPSQGGLGLFVQDGSASFRRVVLEPLPAGQ